MLMRIKRPVRPDPRPLGERTALDNGTRAAPVWLAVRHKRTRPARPAKLSFTSRGLPSSPRS